MEKEVSHYGDGEIPSVPALTKGGRRASVEFTIVILKDEQTHSIGIAVTLRDVTSALKRAVN